jgi:hypothetical protein
MKNISTGCNADLSALNGQRHRGPQVLELPAKHGGAADLVP